MEAAPASFCRNAHCRRGQLCTDGAPPSRAPAKQRLHRQLGHEPPVDEDEGTGRGGRWCRSEGDSRRHSHHPAASWLKGADVAAEA